MRSRATLLIVPLLLAAVAAGAAEPTPTPTPAPAPEAPAPGEYSPDGECSGSSGEHKVKPRGRDIVGAATCRSAVERALRPVVCATARKPVSFEYAYKATSGSGKIYCR